MKIDVWVARDSTSLGVVSLYFSRPTRKYDVWLPEGNEYPLSADAFPEIAPGECRKATMTIELEGE